VVVTIKPPDHLALSVVAAMQGHRQKEIVLKEIGL
jgi:hypothetical protein